MISFANTDNQSLKKLIGVFLEKSGFSPDESVFVVTDKEQSCERGSQVYVVPYDYRGETFGKTFTYSLNNNNADAVLINIQNHTDSKSFEILTNEGMGRVFINNKNSAPVEDVLICAAVFLALGMELQQVLDAFNGILRKH